MILIQLIRFISQKKKKERKKSFANNMQKRKKNIHFQSSNKIFLSLYLFIFHGINKTKFL